MPPLVDALESLLPFRTVTPEVPIDYSSARTRIVALMVALSAMSYFDRTVMSIAGPSIMKDAHISDVEMGSVYSILLFSYTILMTPGGALADRFGPRLVLALAGIGNALLTGLTGLTGPTGIDVHRGFAPPGTAGQRPARRCVRPAMWRSTRRATCSLLIPISRTTRGRWLERSPRAASPLAGLKCEMAVFVTECSSLADGTTATRTFLGGALGSICKKMNGSTHAQTAVCPTRCKSRIDSEIACTVETLIFNIGRYQVGHVAGSGRYRPAAFSERQRGHLYKATIRPDGLRITSAVPLSS